MFRQSLGYIPNWEGKQVKLWSHAGPFTGGINGLLSRLASRSYIIEGRHLMNIFEFLINRIRLHPSQVWERKTSDKRVFSRSAFRLDSRLSDVTRLTPDNCPFINIIFKSRFWNLKTLKWHVNLKGLLKNKQTFKQGLLGCTQGSYSVLHSLENCIKLHIQDARQCRLSFLVLWHVISLGRVVQLNTRYIRESDAQTPILNGNKVRLGF